MGHTSLGHTRMDRTPRRRRPGLIAVAGPAMRAGGLALTLMLALVSPLTPPTSHPASRSQVVTATSRGLRISLSVVPVRAAPGEPVLFTLNVTDRAANGALGYIVSFGDGTSHANVIPMFCLAGKGRPEHEAWRMAHRYARAGSYHVSAIGYANCGPDRASVTRQLVIT
jgi:hypothetical protein